MLVHILRFLGVAPRITGKSGKREAAWLVFACAIALTVFAMWAGVEMVSAMTALLMVIWPSALGLLGAAYKLEFDLSKTERAAQSPNGWPEDIVAPEGSELEPKP
jgi:Flp pilus assembly protein TadB